MLHTTTSLSIRTSYVQVFSKSFGEIWYWGSKILFVLLVNMCPTYVLLCMMIESKYVYFFKEGV
jgi:hypothetical protein